MCFFCFKQKTAYEMRISDWSSDVCSSDLIALSAIADLRATGVRIALDDFGSGLASLSHLVSVPVDMIKLGPALTIGIGADARSEERRGGKECGSTCRSRWSPYT